MHAILAVTVPFFALILMGYLAARRGVLPLAAVAGLNTFVLYFALPAMLLQFGLNTPLRAFLNPTIMGVYLCAALPLLGLAYGWARRQGVPHGDAAFSGLVGVFPNSGFIGVPLIVGLMGAGAAGPVISTLVVDIFITTSVGLALLQIGAPGQQHHGWIRRLWAAFIAPLRMPLPWAIAGGALLSAFDLRLLGPVDSIVRMLAAAASPVALFTLGAVLWRSSAAQKTRSEPATSLSPAGTHAVPRIVLLKLLLHPAAVYGLGWSVQQLGGSVDTPALVAMTLVAALPSASNISMLAERLGADDGLIARIILWSTTLAFLTFSGVAWWFNVQAAGA